MAEVDLTTTYLGLDLANPVVASASPLTGRIDGLHRLAAAGAAAVVLPSLFEEQIEHDAYVHAGLLEPGGGFAEAASGYFPDLGDQPTGTDRHLVHIRDAVRELRIPVIASLNGSSPGGWTTYASMIEDEGVDALELNVYLVAADQEMTGPEVEDRYLQIVEQVRAAVGLPLAVKIGPFFSSPANMARRLADAGADGLVLFNRFYQPDIDLESLEVAPNVVLSTSAESRLVLRWMAILCGRVDADLAATTGIWRAEDVTKMILAGADVTMMTSALLEHGPEHVASVLAGVREWFSSHDYESVAQARGSLSQRSAPYPAAFERANYAKELMTYAATHPVD